jgi:hypothetical protein
MSTHHAVKAFREKENKNLLHSRQGYYKNLTGQGQPLDALLQVKYEGNPIWTFIEETDLLPLLEIQK